MGKCVMSQAYPDQYGEKAKSPLMNATRMFYDKSSNEQKCKGEA